jgi:transcriptional regulator with XRE-family HTH domain
MSKLSQNKSTQYIREQLGLSQIALAQYLSISLSQLAMYEIGKRELPAGTNVKLAEILLFLNEDQKETNQENEIIKKQEAKIQDFLKQQVKELEFMKLKEQRKLEVLQKKFKQNIKLKAFATHLENKKSNLAEVVNIQATTGIEKNGLLAQTIQRLKLESINGQLAYYKSVKEKQKKS